VGNKVLAGIRIFTDYSPEVPWVGREYRTSLRDLGSTTLPEAFLVASAAA